MENSVSKRIAFLVFMTVLATVSLPATTAQTCNQFQTCVDLSFSNSGFEGSATADASAAAGFVLGEVRAAFMLENGASIAVSDACFDESVALPGCVAVAYLNVAGGPSNIACITALGQASSVLGGVIQEFDSTCNF